MRFPSCPTAFCSASAVRCSYPAIWPERFTIALSPRCVWHASQTLLGCVIPQASAAFGFVPAAAFRPARTRRGTCVVHSALAVSFHSFTHLSSFISISTPTPKPMRPETPNHALQRTGAAVTAPASCPPPSPPAAQGPRQPRGSLSLRSLGVLAHTLRTKPKPTETMPELTPNPAAMMDSHLITALNHFRDSRTNEGLLCLTMALQSLHERMTRLEDELLLDGGNDAS